LCELPIVPLREVSPELQKFETDIADTATNNAKMAVRTLRIGMELPIDILGLD